MVQTAINLCSVRDLDEPTLSVVVLIIWVVGSLLIGKRHFEQVDL